MPRVMITCPATGQPVATQLTMDPVTFGVIELSGFVLACKACGGEHRWDGEDAWVDGQTPPSRSREGA